jgi:hypothetical protein
VLDLNRLNQGQFAPLFETLRAAQDPNTGTLPGVTLTQEWMNSVLATMLMDETSFQDFLNGMQADPSAITPLVPAVIGGEASECTQLRSQLQRFFTAVTFQELQTGFTTGVAVNGNINANANTNGNVNANTNANGNVNTNTNDNTGAPAQNTNANEIPMPTIMAVAVEITVTIMAVVVTTPAVVTAVLVVVTTPAVTIVVLVVATTPAVAIVVPVAETILAVVTAVPVAAIKL